MIQAPYSPAGLTASREKNSRTLLRLLLCCIVMLAVVGLALPTQAGDDAGDSGGVQKQAPKTFDETGPETPCEKDSDCWCAVFTGAEFLPGRVPYYCCKERSWNCPEAGKCPVCYYE